MWYATDVRHVDRGPSPVDLHARSRSALERMRYFFSAQATAPRRQDRFEFDSSIWSSCREALRELFASKCAYCETPLTGKMDFDVDHFRPKGSVRTPNARIDSGYWWLAYEWANLYASCFVCAREYKRDFFPLDNESARARSPGDRLENERPLLLDPCLDWPEDHLEFEVAGTVRPRSVRGATTIELCGLNREHLIVRRRDALRQIDALLQRGNDPTENAVEYVLDVRAPYKQAIWQHLAWRAAGANTAASWRARLDGKLPVHTLDRLFRSASSSSPVVVETPVAPPTVDRAPIVRVTRIALKNVRAVKDLEVRAQETLTGFTPPVQRPSVDANNEVTLAPGPETIPLFVFLGENATGKSTVLEALALALGGPSGADAQDAKRWLTRGCRKGRIEVDLRVRDDLHEIVILLDTESVKFEKGKDANSPLVRAYGRVRLADEELELPRPSIDTRNLFSERASLVPIDEFFGSLEGATEKQAKALPRDQVSKFDLCARAVWEVLRGARELDAHEERHLYVAEDGTVRVKVDGKDFSFKELSAGYRSVLALVADILSGVPSTAQVDPHEITGIVIIDEIGTDLHPRWRRRILRDLREAFPLVQFVVSTHEPLCLQGVQREDSIVVLSANEPRVKVFGSNDPTPVGMRADQILVSRYFGLHSTIDEGVDALWRRYYEKLAELITQRDALKSHPSAEQIDATAEISEKERRVRELEGELTKEREALEKRRAELIALDQDKSAETAKDLALLTDKVAQLRDEIAVRSRGHDTAVGLQLGASLREQRLFEIIDEEIARDALPVPGPAAPVLAATTKARILTLWKSSGWRRKTQ